MVRVTAPKTNLLVANLVAAGAGEQAGSPASRSVTSVGASGLQGELRLGEVHVESGKSSRPTSDWASNRGDRGDRWLPG